MPYEDLVESRIQDAMAAGAFSRLKGEGKPFAFGPDHELAGEQWAGHHILQNGGMLPEWLMLAREIELDQERLRELDRRHEELVAGVATADDWGRVAVAIRQAQSAFETAARALRRKQDRFNHDAPSMALERPGIWVEHHLERLTARLRDANAPDWLLLPSV